MMEETSCFGSVLSRLQSISANFELVRRPLCIATQSLSFACFRVLASIVATSSAVRIIDATNSSHSSSEGSCSKDRSTLPASTCWKMTFSQTVFRESGGVDVLWGRNSQNCRNPDFGTLWVTAAKSMSRWASSSWRSSVAQGSWCARLNLQVVAVSDSSSPWLALWKTMSLTA